MKPPDASVFSLLEKSTEILCGLTDPDLRFLRSNALFKKQFRLVNNKEMDRPFHEVIHSYQVDKFIRVRESCINNPDKINILEIKSLQEGGEQWFRWEIAAVTDEQKKIKEISFIGKDITRQKKVELELLKQAVLLDNISDAVIATDLDLCIKSWNFSSEIIFGLRPEEVLDKPVTDFFIIKTVNADEKNIRDIILQKGFWKGELSVKKKNNQKIILESFISLIKKENGEPSGLISINRDISSEKKAKEELVIKKEEFQSFMENTSALAWINDENGTLFYMNSFYKKVFGLTDRAIGKNIFDCFPETMTRGWKATDYEVLNNNARIDAVEKGTDPGGNDVYYQVYKFPVNTLSGKKLVGGQAINITEKTIGRLEVEKQKNLFFSFMENTPSLGWINDENGSLYYMNSLFKKAFGLTDEVIGKNIFDFYPESMKPGCKASDEMVLKTNTSVEVREEGTDREGRPVYYRVFKFPVHANEGKRLIGGQAIDITNETVTQQELIKEKNQFISFMENAPLKAWIIDEHGATRYMNSNFRSFSNFTDENLGKDNHDLYPESIREKARQSISEVLRTKQNVLYQYNYIDKTGKLRYFNTTKFLIQNTDGKNFIGGQAIEVTDIIEANNQVTKEKNRFESFMENAPQLAWVVDEAGNFQYMNSRFKTAFGFSNEQIGQNTAGKDFTDKGGKAPLSNTEILQQNKAIEYLQDWTDRNGQIHYFRTHKFPMPGDDGRFLIGAQAIEITNEVMAKNDLEKMNERFEYASKATRDVIWDWDIISNRIQRFGGNNAFFDFTTRDELMDFNNDNLHPEDAKVAEDSMQAAINSGVSRWMSEFRYKFSAGTYKNVIDQAYIIRDEKGKAIRLIGSMQDVTEERWLQKELLDSELKKKQEMIIAALEAQETERKELSEELHDNVNQLLASALLFLKIVEKQHADSPETRGLIHQSIAFVNSAVTEIRDITHALNSGSLKVKGICETLKDMAESLLIPGKFKVNFISLDIKDELIEKELQLALYRIVQENINNILKHANASVVDIVLSGYENHVELIITDNGKGFDPDVAVKGLGLMNIFNRVESFRGKAELITSPGNGCTVKISIPLNRE